MFKIAAFCTILVSSAVLVGTSPDQAQQFESNMQRPVMAGRPWWNNGWGFAYRESDPAKRKRLASLFLMAHVHAAAQGCGEIEIVHENIDRLFASDAFGPLSPGELAVVGGRISDFKEWLKAQVGEEVCEWAYENFGPNGAMRPALVRARRRRVADGGGDHREGDIGMLRRLLADRLRHGEGLGGFGFRLRAHVAFPKCETIALFPRAATAFTAGHGLPVALAASAMMSAGIVHPGSPGGAPQFGCHSPEKNNLAIVP